MSEFTDLSNEFESLKKELFGNEMFVILDPNNPKVKRYEQLLGFLYPQFRTQGWVSPISGKLYRNVIPVPWGTRDPDLLPPGLR